MKLSLERKILLGYVAAVLVLLGVGATAAWNAVRTTSTFRLVDHTRQVLDRLKQVHADVLAMQNSTRGFVLTGREEFLAANDRIAARVAESLRQLRALTADNPVQQRLLAQLDPLVSEVGTLMRERIAARRARGLDAATDTDSFLRGQQAVDRLRDVTREMERMEQQLLDVRIAAAERAALTTVAAIALVCVVSAALIALGASVLQRDTRRRLAAEAERDRFFTLSLDLLCIANADGYFKRVSPAFTHSLGWSSEELLARPFLEFVHPDDRTATLREVERQVAAGEPVLQFENRYRHKDDSWRMLSWKSVPAPGGFMYATARDVTERHRAEEALRASEERYRMLFSSLDEGFCVIEMIFDAQGKPIDYRFLEVSPSFEKQTGMRNAVGRRMREFAPEHEAHWFEIYGRIALTGEPARFQNRAEQLHRWYDVYAFRIGQPEDRQVAILFNDITERKRAEVALRERTAQLEAANGELEAFSYSVSHDLRAPLRHVNGFAGMLERHAGAALDDKGRRYVSTIREAATQMGRLIDDLLAFSRIGRTTLAPAEVDHDALLAGVIRDGRYDAEPRAIIWEIPPLPRVCADAALLRQVWANLLDNAVKYTRRVTPARIAISCTSTDGARPEHVFQVRDNGVGFDPAYADKLFGVFQRLHDSSQFEGTGIGLANVRRIVSRHGGRTWAESCVGEGAAFYFSLPAGPAVSIVDPRPAAGPAPVSPAGVGTAPLSTTFH